MCPEVFTPPVLYCKTDTQYGGEKWVGGIVWVDTGLLSTLQHEPRLAAGNKVSESLF